MNESGLMDEDDLGPVEILKQSVALGRNEPHQAARSFAPQVTAAAKEAIYI